MLSAEGEGVATLRAAGAGDHVRLLDGRGGVKEWDVPWDGDHDDAFRRRSPGAVLPSRGAAPDHARVELLVALSNPVYVQPS